MSTFTLFLITQRSLSNHPQVASESVFPVTIPPRAMVVLYGGDRFLAANIERLLLSTKLALLDADPQDGQKYFQNTFEAISLANPCHEDGYYMANAILSMAGAEGSYSVLRRAGKCRYWDEWPYFYLGFNYHFFQSNGALASKYMNLAATRASDPDNQRMFKKIALVLDANSRPNVSAAIQFLETEIRQSKDALLKKALKRRVIRLQGLKQLQEAAELYRKRFGRPVGTFQDLVNAKILMEAPVDPLGRGYDLVDGTFKLHP